MRVGLVCPYSFDAPGGVQAHILDLAEQLRMRGHEVQVTGPASESAEVPDFVIRGGTSVPIPYNGSVARLAFGPQVTSRVRSFIREGDFDILHIHEPNSPSFSLAALLAASGPIVATYHASSSGSKLLRASLPFFRGQLEKIRGGIAVSEMARRWQVEMLGGDPVLIPNGVDTTAFEAQRRVREARGETVEIVFLGRLDEPRKGLDVLLEALQHIEEDVRVTVIGGGKARNVPGVQFVGRVSDEEKAKILGRADIYVAPNLGGESFGIVLVEAMAAGAAVVASDLEAFAAVCDAESEQPAGRLFRTGDPLDLAQALQELIRNPSQRVALALAGTRRAQRYDWSTVTESILRVYETVVDGTKVRA